MKVIISTIIIVCIIFGLIACTPTPSIPEKDCIILEAVNMSYGMTSPQEDNWSATTYSLTSKGLLTRTISYTLSGEIVETRTISEEKLMQIINLVRYLKTAKPLFDTEEDGDAWKITYYDQDGKEISSYNGSIYGIKKLEELVQLMKDEFGTDTLMLYAQNTFTHFDEELQKDIETVKTYSITYGGRMTVKTAIHDKDVYTMQVFTISEENMETIIMCLDMQESEDGPDSNCTWEFKYEDKKGQRLLTFNGDIEDQQQLKRVASLIQTVESNK